MNRLTLKQISILIVCLFVTGSQDPCSVQPTPDCPDFAVFVRPGDCVDIVNPCDPTGEFTKNDGFRLCDAPKGIFVRTNRSRAGTTRQICASVSVEPLDSVAVEYIYIERDTSGVGIVYVSTGEGLFEVTAEASPSIDVEPGEEVNLIAGVSGGDPPYDFSWSSTPPGQISFAQSVLQYPVVHPTTTTTYTVLVNDNSFNTRTASVVVNVTPMIVITSALPDTVDSGQSAQLTVNIQQGDGNYTYSWTPAGTLDNPAAASPLATPISTTTYHCDVTDGRGATGTDSATVYVRGATGLLACFTHAPPSPVLFTNITFDATCSDGNIVLYNWWFFGDTTSPPDLSTIDSVIEVSPFDVPGTYPITLEVVEHGGGNTARVTMDVVVQGP